MLKRIFFENFKSWPVLDMSCGKITGIFGTNSSGKSSILQFLLLLKQTKDATDRATSLELNGNLVELGTMSDVLYKHETGNVLKWNITIGLKNAISVRDVFKISQPVIASGDQLEVEAAVTADRLAALSSKLSYKIDGVDFSLNPKFSKNTLNTIASSQFELTSNEFNFSRQQGRAWQLPRPIKSYAFPDQARAYFQNAGFLADLETAYEAALDQFYYLGPMREYPKRDYLWARSRPSDVGKRGERAIDAILAATESGETRNMGKKQKLYSFQEIIAFILRKMGLVDSFRMEEIKEGSNRWQALVRTRPKASEVSLTDVGFGISQVLPVIALLQYVPEGSTVLLEQPEIHLHPLAQAELADVLIQAAMHRNVQVILESHSEHLLLRLQRRIAEAAISADDVKLYFADAAQGESKLTNLELDLYGNIRNWPEKFMGDAFEEAALAQSARLARMASAQ